MTQKDSQEFLFPEKQEETNFVDETDGSPFFEALNMFSYCLLLNFCWLIACLPVITIGPACIALYATLRRSMLLERGHPIRDFWIDFGKNFWRGLCFWLGLVLCGALMNWNVTMFYNMAMQNSFYFIFYFVFIVLSVTLILMALYIFAYQATFHTGIWRVVRNSFIIMSMNPMKNFLIVAIMTVALVLIAFMPIFILVIPVFLMLWFCKYTQHVFRSLGVEIQ